MKETETRVSLLCYRITCTENIIRHANHIITKKQCEVYTHLACTHTERHTKLGKYKLCLPSLAEHVHLVKYHDRPSYSRLGNRACVSNTTDETLYSPAVLAHHLNISTKLIIHLIRLLFKADVN